MERNPRLTVIKFVGGSGTRVQELLPVSVVRLADAVAGGSSPACPCTESVAASAPSESEKSALSKKWGGVESHAPPLGHPSPYHEDQGQRPDHHEPLHMRAQRSSATATLKRKEREPYT